MSENIVYGILFGVIIQLTFDVVGRTIDLLKKIYGTLIKMKADHKYCLGCGRKINEVY